MWSVGDLVMLFCDDLGLHLSRGGRGGRSSARDDDLRDDAPGSAGGAARGSRAQRGGPRGGAPAQPACRRVTSESASCVARWRVLERRRRYRNVVVESSSADKNRVWKSPILGIL